ncbi:hypothetical protein [Bradyrhizobium sp. SEMIA]|uniref:hypothetical protein n=1 Tax=Bradyrhizobium sp. SEMIA TaxID=2597515 RepID=UPI0018A3434A|nr:hypothetical protein [Bradyrhizobium sp. SEMIA]QOG21069.1 hypothetical protein FOM02_30820 [Bradyrhizobium sp. SEMIA]
MNVPVGTQKHITQRYQASRTSTRAPRNSTVTVVAAGDPEGARATSSDNYDTKGTNDNYPSKPAAPIDLNAPGAASDAAAVAGSHGSVRICYNHAWLEAFHNNLCLQIIRLVLSTYATIQFDTRRHRSSYVARTVVDCEHRR